MGEKINSQKKLWTIPNCPSCGSKQLNTDYFSGETFCLKCGLVIF